MSTAVFSTKPYDRSFLEAANERYGNELTFLEYRLTPETAGLASGFPAICAFVNDDLNANVLEELAAPRRARLLRAIDAREIAGDDEPTSPCRREHDPHAVGWHACQVDVVVWP